MEGPELKGLKHTATILENLLLYLVDHHNPRVHARVPDDLQTDQVRKRLELTDGVVKESKRMKRRRRKGYLWDMAISIGYVSQCIPDLRGHIKIRKYCVAASSLLRYMGGFVSIVIRTRSESFVKMAMPFLGLLPLACS